jgi:uncharacterized protein involved in copper resistance
MASAGLRLRYGGWRNVAPYAGYEYEWLFDDTRNQAKRAGEDPDEGRVVAGLRVAF